MKLSNTNTHLSFDSGCVLLFHFLYLKQDVELYESFVFWAKFQLNAGKAPGAKPADAESD